MLGFCVLVFVFSTPLALVYSGPPAERFVYPRLLQARGTNGEILLHIQDGLTLSLEKSSVLADNFVLTTLEGDKQVHTPMRGKELEKDVYIDRSQAAAVTVEEKDGSIQVRGALNPKLRIAPASLVARSEDGQWAHQLIEIEQRGDHGSDYIVPSHLKAQERSLFVFRDRNAQVPENFSVELAFFVHQSFYNEFDNESHIIPYLASLTNLINLRYTDTHDPHIQFILTAVTLWKTDDPVSQTMIKYDVDRPTTHWKKYMASENTLERLATAVRTGKLYTTADMNVLITALDLADMNGAKVENSVLGVAYVGAVCHARLRAALAEDHAYTFATVGVTAHELGHALGCVHDGDIPIFLTAGHQPKLCHPRDGYTMAPIAGGSNFGVFSECSLQQLSSFAGTLTQACFKVQSPKKYTINMKWLPGDWLKKNYYCQRLYPHYQRVTGHDRDEFAQRCKLLCCPQGRLTCFLTDMVDGMSCGNNKVCIRHKCARLGAHPTARPRRSTTELTTNRTVKPSSTTRPRRFLSRLHV